MIYTDRRTQLRLLLGGCFIAGLLGAGFSLYTKEGALSSDSLTAASLFIEKLTKDANFFTPRIRVKEWMSTGEWLFIGSIVGLFFSALFAVGNRHRIMLKFSAAAVMILTFFICLLGVSLLMVVDAIGPVLHTEAIEYCMAPTFPMIMQSLKCHASGPAAHQLGADGSVDPGKLTFPVGCGASCQTKVAFVASIEESCKNLSLLCGQRVYNFLGEAKCMLPDQITEPASFKSPWATVEEHCRQVCDRDNQCTGYMMESKEVETGQYCVVITTTIPGPNWIPEHQNHLTHPLQAQSRPNFNEIAAGGMTEPQDGGVLPGSETAVADNSPVTMMAQHVAAPMVSHRMNSGSARAPTPANANDYITNAAMHHSVLPSNRLLEGKRDLGEKSKDLASVAHPIESVNAAATAANVANAVSIPTNTVNTGLEPPAQATAAAQQVVSVPKPGIPTEKFACYSKGTSKMVAGFMDYVTKFSVISIVYSFVLFLVSSCTIGFLCPFRPDKGSQGFALLIVNCCGGNALEEDDDDIEMAGTPMLGRSPME